MATYLVDGVTQIPENGDTGWGSTLNTAIQAIDGRFTYSSPSYSLASTVLGSSLTSVGTLTSLAVSGAGSIGGDLTVTGNLTVNGSTTTTNSTTVTVDDPIFTLGGDTAPGSDDNKDRGIEFRWHNGAAAKVGFFGFDDSTGKFTFIPDGTNTSEVFSGTIGEIDAQVDWSNVLNKPDPVVTVTLTGDITGTANATLTDLASGTITVATSVASSISTDVSGSLTGDVYASNGTSKILDNGTDGTDAFLTGTVTSVANHNIDALGNVVFSVSPVSGDFLVFNGTNWVSSALSAYEGDTADVNLKAAGSNTSAAITDGSPIEDANGSAASVTVTVTSGFTKNVVELCGIFQSSTATDEEPYLLLQRSTNGGSSWVDVQSVQVGGLEQNSAGTYQQQYSPVFVRVVDTHGASAGTSVVYRFINNTAAIIGGSANTMQQFFLNTAASFSAKEAR
jgi:hypothetical protein